MRATLLNPDFAALNPGYGWKDLSALDWAADAADDQASFGERWWVSLPPNPSYALNITMPWANPPYRKPRANCALRFASLPIEGASDTPSEDARRACPIWIVRLSPRPRSWTIC